MIVNPFFFFSFLRGEGKKVDSKQREARFCCLFLKNKKKEKVS